MRMERQLVMGGNEDIEYHLTRTCIAKDNTNEGYIRSAENLFCLSLSMAKLCKDGDRMCSDHKH